MKLPEDDHCYDRIYDYFIHLGVDFSCNPCKPNNEEPYQMPITAIEVLKNDQPSPGFQIVENQPKNLNSSIFDAFTQPNFNIAIKRSNQNPILSIDLLGEDDEIPDDANIIFTTPSGKKGGFYEAANAGTCYLAYVSGSKLSRAAVVDVILWKVSKNNNIPPSYIALRKSIRQTLFDSEYLILYKISIVRGPLLNYPAKVISRYPMDDLSCYPLPPNIAYFCLYEGSIVDYTINKLPTPNFISFSMTNGIGQKIYAVSMIYYYQLDDNYKRKMSKIIHVEYRSAAILYAGECICLLSRFPIFHKSRMILNNIFSSVSVKNEHMFSHLIPHMIDSIPWLGYSIFGVRYKFMNFDVSLKLHPIDFIVPKNEGSLVLLFNFFTPESLIEIFRCILLERKIIVHFHHPSIVHSVIEALVSLIYPFQWICPYIPLYPLITCEIADSPVPFICGLKTQYFDNNTPPDDVICIDLRNKRIRGVNIKGYQRIELPLKPKNILENRLKFVYSNINREIILKEISRIINGVKIDKITKTIIEKYAIEIRELFLNFMGDILTGYRECFVPFSHSNQEKDYICSVFDKKRFIANRARKESLFYSTLLNTQLFVGYIQNCTFSMKPGITANIISFFDSCCQDKQKDNNLKEYLHRFEYKMKLLEISYKEHKQEYTNDNEYLGRFPRLDTIILRQHYEKRQLNKKIITIQDYNLSYISRNLIEKQKSKMTCINSCSNGIVWAKLLLTQVYSCWFMTIPNIFNNLAKTQTTFTSINIIVELALQKICHMQSIGCNFDNEIFSRVLFNLCYQNKMSRLAQKLMIFFKDMGITVDPISYGLYYQAITHNSQASESAMKLKWIGITYAIMFCNYMTRRAHSDFENDPYSPKCSLSMSSLKHSLDDDSSKNIDQLHNRNNIIHKTTLIFKNYDLENLGEDLIREIHRIRIKDFHFLKKDYSVNTFNLLSTNANEYFEVHMNTRHECTSCFRYLYDSQILSEFSTSDSISLIRCSYCQQYQTCKLNIVINKYTEKMQSDFGDISDISNQELKSHTSEPIKTYSTIYYSPIVLRAELEKVICDRGLEYLDMESFYEHDYNLFWNLVWYFKRLNLTSTIFYNLPQFTGLQKKKIHLATYWDKPLSDIEVERPIACLYRSALDTQYFEKSVEFIKSSLNVSMKAIKQGDMSLILKCLINYRKNEDSIESKKWSLYWEALFIVLLCSSQNVNLDIFDKHYRAQVNLLGLDKMVVLNQNDALPSERANAIRKLFKPLFLEKHSAWVETYIK